MKKVLSTVALGTGLALLSGCGNLLWSNEGPNLTSTAAAATPLSLRAGTFTASAESWRGEPLTLTVTTSETNILSIEVTDHSDTLEIVGEVMTELPARIIAANSTGVDFYTGASTSSRSILTAVEDALVNQAGANLESLRASGPGVGISTFKRGPVIGVGQGGFGGEIELFVNFSTTGIDTISVANHNETEPGINALPQLIAQAETIRSSNVDIVSGATLTSNAFIGALNNAIAQAIVDPSAMPELTLPTTGFDLSNAADGTFVGFAEGHHSTIEATVTISGGAITNITVTHDETPGIGDLADEPMIASIIAAQSTDVDVVSGSSLTSKAIKAAVEMAVDIANGGEAPAMPEETADTTEFNLAGVNDGTFFGRGQGRNEEIDLAVTFAGGSITAIEVLHEADTPDIGGVAMPILIDQTLASGSVDIHTGATKTSNGFIGAMQDAIANSVANNPFEVGSYEYVPADAEDDAVAEETPEQAPAEAPAETPAVEETPAAASTRFTPGSYTGTAQGHHSTVSVTITVDADNITAVSITHGDTEEIVDDANVPATMQSRIIAAQSASVDTVSSATVTSAAIRDAAAAAISQASN